MLHRIGFTTVVLTALAALVTAPAAGSAELLDRKKLAKQVGATVAAAYPDLPVTRVQCRPTKVKRKAGVTATCTATSGTYALAMLVTVVDKKGNVTIASTQAVIPKALAEGFVANNATLPVTVDCGPEPYIVREPGVPFTCAATFADGTAQQVTVAPSDVAGNVMITQVTSA